MNSQDDDDIYDETNAYFIQVDPTNYYAPFITALLALN